MSDTQVAYKTTDLGDTPVTTATPLPVTDAGNVTSNAAINAVLGTTADASVPTDAVGTINSHLRGIVANFVTLIARFPAVAALADALANPSLTLVGSFVHAFNGTTWDRIRSGAVANVASVVGFINNIGVGIYNSSAPTITDGRYNAYQIDVNANLKTSMGTALAASIDSITAYPVGNTYNAVIVADAQIKGSSGVLDSIMITCNDAAPTAGSLIIYDSLTETGTQVFNHTFTTTPFTPICLKPSLAMLTGIYAGFTTTGDVNVTIGYR